MIEAQYGGTCEGELSETTECNMQVCNIDCVVGEWSEWGECSAECDGGKALGTRPVITEARYVCWCCLLFCELHTLNWPACPEETDRVS